MRSFYEFLVEDGLRERNPVRRGQSGRRGKRPRQGLVRRVEQAPWIPTDAQWQQILQAATAEPVRNRLMIALAYDGGLRREELVLLEVGDFEPAYSLVRLRAVTTKSKRSREVSYGSATAQLFMQYLAVRRQMVGWAGGRLLLSTSRRNRPAPLGASSWPKIVTRLARRAGVHRLSPHTFQHLRLTDLARADWTLDQIAQYGGHQGLSTTLRYIRYYGEILQRTLGAAYRKADYFTRNVRTIQVLIDRESILTGTAASGQQPWKYYDLGDGYCSYDFFAKCPHRLACAKCSFYLPKQSNAGQLLAVKDGIDRMLEQLDLTDDERAALEGDRAAVTALAQRLANIPTPAGPTPQELGTTAFIALTEVRLRPPEAP